MAIIIYPGSVYPTGLDSFLPRVTDGIDTVLQSHTNSHSEAIEYLQQKVGIDGSPITGLGGVSFDSAGKVANPGGPGIPTIWIDNTIGVNFDVKYTDNLGSTFSLLGGLWTDVANQISTSTVGKGLTVDGVGNFVDLDSDTYSLVTSTGNSYGAGYGTVVTATGGKLVVGTTGAGNDLEVTSADATLALYSGADTTITDLLGGSITLDLFGITINTTVDFNIVTRDIVSNSSRNTTFLFDSDSTTGETFTIRHGGVPTDLMVFTSGGDIVITPDSSQDFIVTTAGSGGDITLNSAGGDINFFDDNKAGSTYVTPYMAYSSAAADWNSFVSYFGDGTTLLESINTCFDTPIQVHLSNIAALRAFPHASLSSGYTVNVGGYYSEGDGGGGTFFWDGTEAVANDNGGTIIAPTGALVGCWKRIFSGVYNAQWFGISTNVLDVADNSVVINAMITAIAGAGLSLAVYIPSGSYHCNTTIVIDGSRNINFYGDGKSTILDFTGIAAASDCLHLKEVDRSRFADFVINGRSDDSTKGIRIGDDIAGTVSSANWFYNIELKNHEHALYGEGGVTNRFYGLECTSSTYAITLTAQSNVYSFFGCYFLQNGQWFTITNSEASFYECTFQRILTPSSSYAMLVRNSEVSIFSSYFEKDENTTNFALVQCLETSDILVASFTLDGGHITPDGNSIVYYDGSPIISIKGVNNSVAAADSSGLRISRINACDYGLYNTTMEPCFRTTSRQPVQPIAEISYGKDATESWVTSVNSEYATVQGTIFDETIVVDEFYTLVIVGKYYTDIPADNPIYIQQKLIGANVDRQSLLGLPKDSEIMETFYVPFKSRGDQLILEVLAGDYFKYKNIRLYKGTYFPKIDPSYKEEVLLDSAPTADTWSAGDIVFNKDPSYGEDHAWTCITAGTPGTWKSSGEVGKKNVYFSQTIESRDGIGLQLIIPAVSDGYIESVGLFNVLGYPKCRLQIGNSVDQDEYIISRVNTVSLENGYSDLSLGTNDIRPGVATRLVVTQGESTNFSIVGVDTINDEFDILGDHASYYPAGTLVAVVNSTGNDGTYTVAPGGATYVFPNTTIPVVENVVDATVDGEILNSGSFRVKVVYYL